MPREKKPKLLHAAATQGGDEELKTPGLVQRKNRYQFRRRIPEKIRSLLGKREFVKSLGDVPFREAKRLAGLEWAVTGEMIAEAERRLAGSALPAHETVNMDAGQSIAGATTSSILSKTDIGALARRYFAELEHSTLNDENFNEKSKAQLIEDTTDELVGLRNGPEDASVQQVAIAAARWANLPISPVDPNFFALCEAVHAALVEHLSRQLDRFSEQPPRTRDYHFSEQSLAEAMRRPAPGPSLSDIVARWAVKADPPQLKSVDKARSVVADFTAHIAIVPVTQVTPDHVQALKEHLLGKTTSAATAANKLNIFRALLSFAHENRVIASNPCAGITIKPLGRAKDKRLPYSKEALAAVFSSPIYSKDARPKAGCGEAAYWLPLLALYTGARLNELGQLRPKDITFETYIDSAGKDRHAWIVNIVEDEADGLRLKNAGSERRVPVHPDLIGLGFVRFVEAAQVGKRDRLFTGLTKDKFGNITAQWSKWYGRYLRGACKVTDPKITFHSFRHTFKHWARASNVNGEVHDAITGHHNGDVGSSYGDRHFPLHPLVEGMRAFRIVGFSLPRPPPQFRD